MVQIPATLTLALIIAGAVISGCGSSQSARSNDIPTAKTVVPADSLDPELEALNPEFTITGQGGRRFTLNFRAGGGGAPNSPAMNALRRLSSVGFQIYAPDGRQVAALATQEINTSGTANAETGQASLTAFANIEWESPEPLIPGTFAIAVLRSDRGAFARRVELPGAVAQSPAEAAKSIDMQVEVENRVGGVEFVITARRIAPGPEQEYIPSGEKYRIEIRNDVGETIWSSSTGKFFTQALVPMSPGSVGDEVRYREFWDGRHELTRLPQPAGVFRLTATIPAVPRPYIIREEFTWSGSR